jgi:16S rRNA (cytosine1402-N4)-methyltransferase
MAKLFQALRIEVNGEMKALQQMLKAAVEILRPGGRLVVLTYHSLEDRLVKNMIHAGNVEGNAETNIYGHTLSPLKSVGRNYIAPDEEEQTANPRSRSAKLRVAERTNIE